MNIRIKQAMMAAGIATAMALPMSSQASDGTLTFTGAVTANSCTLKVNGATGATATVALPTVDTAALTNVAPQNDGGWNVLQHRRQCLHGPDGHRRHCGARHGPDLFRGRPECR